MTLPALLESPMGLYPTTIVRRVVGVDVAVGDDDAGVRVGGLDPGLEDDLVERGTPVGVGEGRGAPDADVRAAAIEGEAAALEVGRACDVADVLAAVVAAGEGVEADGVCGGRVAGIFEAPVVEWRRVADEDGVRGGELGVAGEGSGELTAAGLSEEAADADEERLARNAGNGDARAVAAADGGAPGVARCAGDRRGVDIGARGPVVDVDHRVDDRAAGAEGHAAVFRRDGLEPDV